MNCSSITLMNRANSNLLKRLQTGGYSYTPLECAEIEDLDHQLIDQNNPLDRVTIERLRALASLSQTKLTFHNISSHRKIIGPIIVAGKKLLWPFINAQLKNVLKAQREFNERILEQQILSLQQLAKK